MARFLRKSTAATIKMGPFVSPVDGYTSVTAASFTAKLAKAGAAFAARADATAITHDADGYYAVVLGTGDTDTVGRLRVETPGTSTYLPVMEDFVILDGAVYDSLFGTVALSTYAGADTAGTTTLLGRLTNGRASNLDNLDALISTRSTYAGADTTGTTTLLNRLSVPRTSNLDNLDALISSRLATSGYTAAPSAATIATTVDGALTRTGFSLAPTGLDSIAIPTLTGPATTFPGMVAQLWRRFFKKATKTTTQIKTYADDGTTVITTQAVSDDGTTQTQGAGA